jgi:hypothetical protein
MQKKEITFTTAKVNEMADNLEADKVSISKFLTKFQEAERNKDGGIQKLDVSTSPAIASLQKLINDVVPAVQVFSAEEANCPVTTAKKLDSGFTAIKSSLKLDQISKDFADESAKIVTTGQQAQGIAGSHEKLVPNVLAAKTEYMTAKQAFLNTNGGDVSPDIKNNLGKIVASLVSLAEDTQKVVDATKGVKASLESGQIALQKKIASSKADMTALKKALNDFTSAIGAAKAEAEKLKDKATCDKFKKAYADLITAEGDLTGAQAKVSELEIAVNEAAVVSNGVAVAGLGAVNDVSSKAAGTKVEILDAKDQLKGVLDTIL